MSEFVLNKRNKWIGKLQVLILTGDLTTVSVLKEARIALNNVYHLQQIADECTRLTAPVKAPDVDPLSLSMLSALYDLLPRNSYVTTYGDLMANASDNQRLKTISRMTIKALRDRRVIDWAGSYFVINPLGKDFLGWKEAHE